VATKLKDLELDDAHATAILQKAIEYEAFNEDMPGTKKARISAATDQIALMIDAWTGDDQVNPDNEDPAIAEMGQAIEDIFELAGIEINEEGEVEYVEPSDVDDEDDEDEADEDDNEDDDDGDDEAVVDINDIIEGYDDLSAAAKVKAIKKLELDMAEDEDYNTAVAFYEYEEAQEQPSSRVLTFLDDLLPANDGDSGEEEPEDEDGDEDGEEEAEEGGAWEQPWTKADGAPADYDKQSAVDVKKYLDKLLAKEELTAELVQYVIDYEEQREKPTRKRVIDHSTKLLEELDGGGEADEPDEEEEQEEAPKRSGRPKRSARTRSSSRRQAEPEEEDEPEEDEQSDDNGGVFVISGGEEDTTAYGPFQAAGIVADLLVQGISSITVEAG
jgi:hypothetical protein